VIGGDWVEAESGKTYPVYNPATEEEIGKFHSAEQPMPIKPSRRRVSTSGLVEKIAGRTFSNRPEIARIARTP